LGAVDLLGVGGQQYDNGSWIWSRGMSIAYAHVLVDLTSSPGKLKCLGITLKGSYSRYECADPKRVLCESAVNFAWKYHMQTPLKNVAICIINLINWSNWNWQ
jgi:hypothetical protein